MEAGKEPRLCGLQSRRDKPPEWVSFTSSFETAASRPPQDEVKPKLQVLILRSVALATRLEG